MLICPRYLCIEVGENDPLFLVDGAKAEYEKLKNTYDEDWFDFIVFDGEHEFCKSDVYIEKLISKLI